MHTTLQCFSIQKGVLYRHLLKSYTISVKASLNEKQYYAVIFHQPKVNRKCDSQSESCSISEKRWAAVKTHLLLIN